jgi:hypothetical protein
MAAGFKDLLAWLLGWKSSYVPMIGGPYQVAAVQTFQAGAILGQNYHTGAIVGQNYYTGATAGACNG